MKQFLIFLFTGASIAILDLVDSAFGNQISLDSICVMSAFTVLYWCFSALCTVGEYAYRVKLKYESECFTLQVTITLICSFILIVFRVPLSHIYSLTDTQYDLLAMCLLCKGICLIFGKLETFFRTYIALSCQNKHIIISNIIFYSTMIVADAIVIALHGECYHLVITTGIADAITVIYYLIFCRYVIAILMVFPMKGIVSFKSALLITLLYNSQCILLQLYENHRGFLTSCEATECLRLGGLFGIFVRIPIAIISIVTPIGIYGFALGSGIDFFIRGLYYRHKSIQLVNNSNFVKGEK